MNKKKIVTSKVLLRIVSIGFVLFFFIILILSIGGVIFSNFDTISHGNWNYIISFFHDISKFDTISDPFSVFIELLSSIGGVFFGIKIGQWIDNREDMEQLSELWSKIYRLLKKLKTGIENNENSIYELAEYRIYWDSLLRADSVATRFLQSDNMYVDISYTFSFLSFYINSWKEYQNINEWNNNAFTTEKERIQNWIKKLDELIIYTHKKLDE